MAWVNLNDIYVPNSRTVNGKELSSNVTLGAGDIKLSDGTTMQAAWDSVSQIPENKVLWSGALYMYANHTINLSETVSSQPHGIVLVWSGFRSNEAQNYDWNYFFVPKHHTNSTSNGNGVSCFIVSSDGLSICTKYVYVHDTKIVGNDQNIIEDTNTLVSGIKRSNKNYVLRYVIGV